MKAGHIIGVTQMNGISPANGGTVTFNWTPTHPGLHQLHEVLLGTSNTGEDDEQIMRVTVAAPLSPYHVHAPPTTPTSNRTTRSW